MTVVLPITGSPNWDTPLNTALLDLQTQAQAAQTTANSAITVSSTKVIKDSLVFNVKDHGAIGNGATDDTAAIQATINLASATGGIVFLPSGTYNLSSSLTLANNITIAGAGWGSTFIQQNSTTSSAFVQADASTIRFQSIRINGPGSGTGYGIRFTTSVSSNTPYISMEDVFINGFGVDGINISLPLSCAFTRVVVRNCGAYGFNMVGVNLPTASAVTFQSCYANGNTTGGIRLFRVAGASLTACTVISSTTGFLVDSSDGVALVGCATQSCNNGVSFSTAIGCSVVDYFNYDNKGIGIRATSNSTPVSIYNAVELTPNGTATRFVQVDSGSYATLVAVKNVTANLFTGPGHILDDAAGTIVAAGDVKVGTVGKTLYVKEGTNAKMGTSSLVAGSAVVNTTAVTASSRIFLTPQNTSGTAGAVSVSARTAGTSFTMTSTSGTDTRSIAWLIIEPA